MGMRTDWERPFRKVLVVIDGIYHGLAKKQEEAWWLVVGDWLLVIGNW